MPETHPYPTPLGEVQAQPYRVPLASAAPPEGVLAGLVAEDHPGALWGEWFGGGLVVVRRPLLVYEPRIAADGFGRLDELPVVDRRGFDGIGGGWLVALGYDPGHSWIGFYDSVLRWRAEIGWEFEALGLPGREVAEAEAEAGWRATLAAAITLPPGEPIEGFFATRRASAAIRLDYLAAVEEVIGRIDWGDFYQMNLCLRLHALTSSPAPALFARLAERLAPAYAALVPGPRGEMTASFSPELFLRVRGRDVMTAPIKGTAPRAGDDHGATRLRASAKDAAENIMITDLMRNDLSRVCRPGSVAVQELLSVQPHPGVWHLVSTVRGTLTEPARTSDLLAATFPPGSVTGAPKLAAQRGIAELETEPRGAYTGSIGLVSACAGTDLNVIIRSFEIRSGGRIELGVGGGITTDSVPIREWYECLHKAAPLVAAAGAELDPSLIVEPDPPAAELLAAGVFETVLVQRGLLLRLAGHLARLDRSCRELYGFGLPVDLADQLRRRSDLATAERMALRISVLPIDGGLQVSTHVRPLGPRPASGTLLRSERPVRSWRHKWLDRAALTAAEEKAGGAMPYFTFDDAVTETSRGNLFWRDVDGTWRTPPLDEQVLPGVTRREVVEQLGHRGDPVRIGVGSVADLHSAYGVFWTSSLSGAVPVTAVDGHSLPDVSAFTDQLNAWLQL